MFEKVLAIDVASRVPHFADRVKDYAASTWCVGSIDDAVGDERDFVDAIVVSIHQSISEAVLADFPRVRYIGVLGTSLKKLPVDYCRARGIIVTNVTEYCDEDTAEWVMMRALEFFRGRSSPQSLAHKAIGLVGVGAVAKHVMQIARGLDMDVAVNSRREEPELVARGMMQLSKEELFARCHIVSIHTPAFFAWLDKDILHHAREDLCIINTCMGRISVDDHLEAFLDSRPDVTLIMDKIAGDNYPTLTARARIFPENAFSTEDSAKRLVNKFFANFKCA